MSGLLVAVAVLAVAAVVAVVVLALSDSTIARRAETRAARYVGAAFHGAVDVRVRGAPFLTQALRGRYGEVELSGADLRVGEIAGASLSAWLYNVYLPVRVLLGRRLAELPCERVAGTLLVPWPELARLSRVPTLALTHDGSRLRAAVSVPIPGISSLARVSGEALPSVDDEGTVWLRMRRIAVAGVAVPSVVLTQLLPALRYRVTVRPLPYGLRIVAMHPTPAGLDVRLSADAVVFRQVRAGS